jgi:hypothetical protein
MQSFKNFFTEQIRITDTAGLVSAINEFKKAGEIINPEYVQLGDSAKRLFRKESDATQNHALDLLRKIREEKGDDSIVQDFYYSISDSFAGLGKLQKMAEKNKNSSDKHVKSIVDEVNMLVAKWKPIADDLKDLKGKVVKVTTKRAETKAVAAKAMERKFADSSSLIKVFEDHLEEYKKGAREEAQKFIDARVAALEKAGWDLNVVAPEPKSGYGTEAYKMAQARRAVYTSITKAKASSRKPNEPDIRELNKTMVDHYINQNVQAAEDDYRAFMQKMIEKIGKPVVKATMTGSIWRNAVLTVETNDGEEQVWNTQMIINYSKYQRAYNQFPSRRKK